MPPPLKNNKTGLSGRFFVSESIYFIYKQVKMHQMMIHFASWHWQLFGIATHSLTEVPFRCMYFIGCFKPCAVHPVTTAAIEALRAFCFSGLWPEIQATRLAGGR